MKIEKYDIVFFLCFFSDITHLGAPPAPAGLVLVLQDTDSLGAGTAHTESVTEIAIGAVLLPRSLIAVSC